MVDLYLSSRLALPASVAVYIYNLLQKGADYSPSQLLLKSSLGDMSQSLQCCLIWSLCIQPQVIGCLLDVRSFLVSLMELGLSFL